MRRRFRRRFGRFSRFGRRFRRGGSTGRRRRSYRLRKIGFRM